jgi:hypothetical protein
MPVLDEAVFKSRGVISYSAEAVNRNAQDCLQIKVLARFDCSSSLIEDIRQAVSVLPPLASGVGAQKVSIKVMRTGEAMVLNTFVNKRSILDKRNG